MTEYERKQNARRWLLRRRRLQKDLPSGTCWWPALLTLLRDVRCIGGYWPLQGEPDLREFFRRIADVGIRTALPCIIEDSRMIYRAWDPLSGRPDGRDVAGIPAPSVGKEITPDLVLAPCVGWSASGHRLGYGGGWYDRWHEKHPTIRIVGVVSESSRIEGLEFESFDLVLDAVVTPRGRVRYF